MSDFTGGSNDTITWQPEPNVRGTFTILSTCIITLLLCVYSSVHLNLPAIDRSKTFIGLRRAAWVLCGLIAPEFIIFTAQGQHARAKQISKEARAAFNTKGDSLDTLGDVENLIPARRHAWTMTHSFWAIMGGIATQPDISRPFIPSSAHASLTANGVSFLLKHEPSLLPDISVEDVKDKSKANSLTKSLACIQATWFCLSCITRFAQHLPVSMLELNAFAHALCTLAVYVLWWRKPLDVSQPFLISDEELSPLLAYMWMASKTSCIPKPKSKDSSTSIKVGRDPEFEAITLAEGADLGALGTWTSQSQINPLVTSSSGTLIGNVLSGLVTTTASLHGTNFCVNKESTRWKVVTSTTSGDEMNVHTDTSTIYHPAVFNLSSSDARRWQLAHLAMRKYNLPKPTKNLGLVTIKAVKDTIDMEEEPAAVTVWSMIAFVSASAAYGSFHALAWNAHFPSHRERMLWHVSACIVACPVIGLAIMFLIAVLESFFKQAVQQFFLAKKTRLISEKMKDTSEKKGARSCFWLGSILSLCRDAIAIVLALGIVFLYVPARAYLVYESFRTVFFLPPGAFETPQWTQYLIHVT